MINKLQGFTIIEKIGLKHPNWKIIRSDLSNDFVRGLDDGKIYTVRTAVVAGEDFGLPRMVGVLGSEVKKRLNQLLENFDDKKSVYLIIYETFKARFSGNILITFKGFLRDVVVEACDGSLWNLVENNIVDYNARIKMKNSVIVDEESNIPEWEWLKKNIMNILTKASTLGLTEEGTILIEWSFTGEEFLFYELKSV